MDKVLFDCERMKYPYTGLYYFCRELGQALIRQTASAAFRLAFYVPEKEKGVFGASQKYILQHAGHKFFPSRLSQCRIWHSTYQGTNYLPYKVNGLKIVSTIHDLNFLHDGRQEAKKKKYLYKTQQLIDKADRIVAISQFVKNEIEKNLDTGGKPVQVIYNGKSSLPEGLKKPQGDFSTPYFFSIGTIASKKNFHVLPALLRNNNFQLIIAGINQEENYRKKIMDVASQLGVAQRVRLIGPVSEAEKYWLIENSVLFCFPSIAEGFGIPVIEAMQMGKQVLLSNHTSLPEVGGPHALFLENFDPDYMSIFAENYISNLDQAQVKKEVLQKWASKFDWDVAAKQYIELYKSLL